MSETIKLKIYFDVKANRYIEETSCYCGGFIRCDITKRNKKIINCFGSKINPRFEHNEQYVDITEFFKTE